MSKQAVPPNLKPLFPTLEKSKWGQTSPVCPKYNCIAWAANDSSRFWWPLNFGYWPQGVPRKETLDAFVLVFETLKYQKCSDGSLEIGYEKIALYENSGIVTHAARQLSDGMWTSKLGQNMDIVHELDALNGPVYGKPTAFMKRPLISKK